LSRRDLNLRRFDDRRGRHRNGGSRGTGSGLRRTVLGCLRARRLNFAADIQLRTHHFAEVRSFLGRFKLLGEIDMDCFVQIRPDDDGAGRGNYFGEAEEEGRNQNVDGDRADRHGDEVTGRQGFPRWEKVQVGHNFG
jgi:hypothetical protein